MQDVDVSMALLTCTHALAYLAHVLLSGEYELVVDQPLGCTVEERRRRVDVHHLVRVRLGARARVGVGRLKGWGWQGQGWGRGWAQG
jgi:hypothetical protein